MRIVDFRTTIVSIPFTEPVQWKFGQGRGVSGNVAMGGIDMALWDLVGKATNQPLYKLLEEPSGNRFPITAGYSIKTWR